MKIIIVGAGEVGFHIAQRLVLENKDVVIIDVHADALKRVSDHIDVQTIHGSGSSPKVLIDAGIRDADIMLAVTDSDEINLISCFFAHSLAPNVSKVARIRNEEYTDYQDALVRDILDISMVINPEVEVVKSIEHLISVPNATEINEFAGGRIRMIGIQLDERCPVHGMSLPEIRKRLSEMIIGAIVRNDKLIIPRGQDEVRCGDLVYFVCDQAYQGKILDFFGFPSEPLKNILIVGGGNIGYRLAQRLDSRKYHTKIIESDQLRSQFLSAKLDRPVVLHGDGTDQELLREENIDKMDIVVCLTGDDETNILSCLLARSMGARRTVARINKFAYIDLVRTIGINQIVSSRLSAINSTLHSIRKGKVLSTVSIKGEDAEALEAIALENSAIVGKPLMELEFPSGAVILCIVRQDQVIIPTGTFVIEPQDRIIIMSTRKNVPEVEKALTVKLEYI